MPRVLIAVPTFENIYPDTFKSIYDLDKPCECMFEFVRGYDCATARNNIAEKAKELGATHVLMVDSDVVLPKDALVNLMSHNVDMCFGYYAHRNRANDDTQKTNLCKLGELNYTNQFTFAEIAAKTEEMFRVHGGGMGCALIKTSVFERIGYPYYKWTDYGKGLMLSEDLFFCEKCKAEHIKLYADPRVKCGHMFRYLNNGI